MRMPEQHLRVAYGQLPLGRPGAEVSVRRPDLLSQLDPAASPCAQQVQWGWPHQGARARRPAASSHPARLAGHVCQLPACCDWQRAQWVLGITGLLMLSRWRPSLRTAGAPYQVTGCPILQVLQPCSPARRTSWPEAKQQTPAGQAAAACAPEWPVCGAGDLLSAAGAHTQSFWHRCSLSSQTLSLAPCQPFSTETNSSLSPSMQTLFLSPICQGNTNPGQPAPPSGPDPRRAAAGQLAQVQSFTTDAVFSPLPALQHRH